MTHPLKNDMTDGGGRLNFGEGRGFPSTTDKQLISHDYLVVLSRVGSSLACIESKVFR